MLSCTTIALAKEAKQLVIGSSIKQQQVGPCDFDAENVDGIMESSHKNGIYCITRNITEFAKLSHKHTI